MVYRLRIMSKEQDAARRYGSLDSTRNRIRFAARILIQTGLVYNAAFMLFIILAFVSAFGTYRTFASEQFTKNTYLTIERSVRSTRSATHFCDHLIWCRQFLQGIGLLSNIMIIRALARQDGQSAPSERLPTTGPALVPTLKLGTAEMEVIDIHRDYSHEED
jgi:hypothetical protein